LRYDAAIIGAGAEGLAAATLLGRAGLRVVVIERRERAGGRCVTREFHPGYRASPFVDEVGEIPAELYWQLDLARHGAVFVPRRCSHALWRERCHTLRFCANGDAVGLLTETAQRRRSIAARAIGNGEPRSRLSRSGREPWPGADWATAALADVLAGETADEAAHLAALALAGRAADPYLAGSALHLLGACASAGRLAGGLGRLGEALHAAAEAAGVQFAFGLEASDIQRRDGRLSGVALADGSEIAAQSVISTLDLKRTFLSFFAWNALPRTVVRRVNAFRMAGSTARVLFALSRPPEFVAREAEDGPIHVAPSLGVLNAAYQDWRLGVVAERLPVVLNVVSAHDTSLAPADGAVVTATLGAVPFRPFDGAWTHEKRELLRKRALDAAESVSPGFAECVVGSDVVAPPDIEDALGATDADLAGGEIAGDQMLGMGPWDEPALPRTPIAGLYLAGSHLTAGAFATCAAGASAARALLADRARGRRP
jgi:phytoene dehydrogenase-like protein